MRWAAESLYICGGNIMAAIEYHLRQEKKKQAAIENLHQARLEVGEQTMKQVGRELHDSVGISLSLGRMRLQQLAQQLPAAEKELNEVAGLILDGLNRVRSISHGLHATHLQNEGLQAALEEEFTKTAESGQYQKQFSIQGESFFMDDNRELLVYRIAQEALHNIVKHANATTIHMHLQYTPTQFKLQLVDDGVGLPANYGGGMGMKNMHLRAASLGGRFEVAPGPQGGTVVELLVPQG
jgi:signal transduction histidine kinase